MKWPRCGPDAIVFGNGGLLYSYDLASGKTSGIPITVNSDDIVARAGIKTVAGNIGSWSISPTGVSAVFEARGNIFTVPAEHGRTATLTPISSLHDRNPASS